MSQLARAFGIVLLAAAVAFTVTSSARAEGETSPIDESHDIQIRATGIGESTGDPCISDAACSDGMYCNGEEVCVDGDCRPAAQVPCLPEEVCNETLDACLHDCDNYCDSLTHCVFDGIDNLALGGAVLTFVDSGFEFVGIPPFSLSGFDDEPGSVATHGRDNDASAWLHMTNIGPSGLDGVRQDPLPAGTTQMITGIAGPNFVNSIQGASMEVKMFGDVPGDLISTMHVMNTDGDNMTATVDFSPVGVTLYTAQIMIRGRFVATVSDLPAASVSFPKTDINAVSCSIEPDYHISIELGCVVPISIGGLQPVLGNSIWIIAQDPKQEAGEQTRIDTTFVDTGDIDFTFEYAGPSVESETVCGQRPDNEPCCHEQVSPGCEDYDVCECVCAVVPECCTFQWDTACAAAVDALGCGLRSVASGGFTHVVQQVGFTFVPADITVRAGSTIEWHWESGAHTITSGTPCTADGQFLTEPLSEVNPVVSFVVPSGPTFIPYFCTPHCKSSMVGTITIEQGPTYCKGDCCEANDIPGCDTPSIEGCVCASQPDCCAAGGVGWDSSCVAAVESLGCGTCSPGGAVPHACTDTSTCVFDGILNQGLGGATLALGTAVGNPGDTTLIVSNIGSSGLDGVSQDPLPPDSTSMTTGFACPNFAQSVQGAMARIEMHGDISTSLLSTLTIENVLGETIRASIDLSPVGVTSYTVQIMIGDHMTASASGLSIAELFFLRDDVTEGTCTIDPGAETITLSFSLSWVTPITLPGVGTAEGNVVRIIGRMMTAQELTRQTRIDNFFANTGPVEMTFQYSGPSRPQPPGALPQLPPLACGASTNNFGCCDAQPTPGCLDAAVCQCVCEIQPDCCLIAWDESCVALIDDAAKGFPCGQCDPPGTPCVSDGDCDDGNASTADQCCLGECVHEVLCPIAEAPLPVSIADNSGLLHDLTANRFLIFEAGNAGSMIAIRVIVTDLSSPYGVWNGKTLWVQEPFLASENGSSVGPLPGFDSFSAATLGCDKFYTDWSAFGEVHVFHESVIPMGRYTVQTVHSLCDAAADASYSAALVLGNPIWGDVLEDFSVDPPGPPDGGVSFLEVLGIIKAFQSDATAPGKARADLEPRCVDLLINISDALQAVNAFSGLDYPFPPSADDPCDSVCVIPLP